MDELPNVSIVIPTLNSEKTLRECLDSVNVVDYPRDKLQVIVVDGGSTDRTLEIAKQYPVSVFSGHGKLGGDRNIGVKNAKGDVIVFIDSDVSLPSDYVRKIVQEFIEDLELDGVGGLDLNPEGDQTDLERAVGIMNTLRRLKPEVGWKAGLKIRGVSSAYRRESFIKYGGDDPSLRVGNESEFHARIMYHGGRLKYNPRIYLYHHRHNGNVGVAARSEFIYSLRMAPILFRRWVLKAASRDPSSPVATSYYLLIGSLTLSVLFVFALLSGSWLHFLLVCTAIYLLSTIPYTVLVHTRTKTKRLATVHLVLTIDMICRITGIYCGIIKMIYRKIRRESEGNNVSMDEKLIAS